MTAIEDDEVRLNVEYLHRLSLTGEDLSSVEELLLQDDKLEDEAARSEFVKRLMERDKVISVINYIIKDEINRNKLGILREESLGANLMKTYWFHHVGKEYLIALVAPLVKNVKASSKGKPLEVDSSKVEATTAKKNLKKAISLVREFRQKLFFSEDQFPEQFRAVLIQFYKLLTEVEGASKSHLGLGYSETALRLFGGFLLLRFICPAIVSPQKYGVVKDISPNTQRSLILISKLLQCVANQVEMEQEEYMQPANDFAEETVPQFLAFINVLVDEDRTRTRTPPTPKYSKKDLEKKEQKAQAALALSRAGFL